MVEIYLDIYLALEAIEKNEIDMKKNIIWLLHQVLHTTTSNVKYA